MKEGSFCFLSIFCKKNKTVLQLSENVTKPPVCPSGGRKQNQQNPWLDYTGRNAPQKHRIFKRPKGDDTVSRHFTVTGRSVSVTELELGYGKGGAEGSVSERQH